MDTFGGQFCLPQGQTGVVVYQACREVRGRSRCKDPSLTGQGPGPPLPAVCRTARCLTEGEWTLHRLYLSLPPVCPQVRVCGHEENRRSHPFLWEKVEQVSALQALPCCGVACGNCLSPCVDRSLFLAWLLVPRNRDTGELA